MKKLNLDKNGVEVFNIDQKIKDLVSNSIRKNIITKLNLNSSYSFNKISKKLNELDDKVFSNLFGVVSYRYLPTSVTKKINLYLKKFKLNKNVKKISLHKLSKSDLLTNKDLKINQYCVYYRVVRKNKNDTPYPHRDSDFWEAHKFNKNLIPKITFKYTQRLKVWFPIFGCNKQNSLRFFKNSHLQKIKSNFKMVKGFKKPIIDKKFLIKNKKNIIMPIQNFNKNAVLFHDDCVHFAPVNKVSNLRISCEFTAMIAS